MQFVNMFNLLDDQSCTEGTRSCDLFGRLVLLLADYELD